VCQGPGIRCAGCCDAEGDESNTTHAGTGSIAGPQGSIRCGQDLGETSGAASQVTGQPPEVRESSMDGRGEADALTVMVTKRLLQVTEKAAGARDAKQHAAKLPQKLLPFGEGDTFLVGRHRGEDFQEAFHSVWREGNGLLNGVDEPAEDDFPGGPTTITLQELLNRDGLLPVWTVPCVQWAKDSVDSREEDAPKALPAEGAPLGQANGIVNKDIEVGPAPSSNGEREDRP